MIEKLYLDKEVVVDTSDKKYIGTLYFCNGNYIILKNYKCIMSEKILTEKNELSVYDKIFKHIILFDVSTIREFNENDFVIRLFS
jgi:hypothetical protein